MLGMGWLYYTQVSSPYSHVIYLRMWTSWFYYLVIAFLCFVSLAFGCFLFWHKYLLWHKYFSAKKKAFALIKEDWKSDLSLWLKVILLLQKKKQRKAFLWYGYLFSLATNVCHLPCLRRVALALLLQAVLSEQVHLKKDSEDIFQYMWGQKEIILH